MRMTRRCIAIALTLLILLQSTACSLVNSTRETDTTAEKSTTASSALTHQTPTVVLPTWLDAETASALFLTSEGAVVDCSEQEYSYIEMVEDLEMLKALYPTHFDYRVFGKSAAGRDLYVATLGNPNAPKQFLVSAGIHGREYLTPLLVMKQMEFYLAYYDVGDYDGLPYAELFENFCFYVVPMTNPDGIMLSQEGMQSLSSADLRQRVIDAFYRDYQDKYTTQTAINEYLKTWKANANAVDLNRNFDALWESVNTGMSRPSHKNYKGESVASEPETQAMVRLTEGIPNIQAVLCIHSQGEVLYWDCGQSGSLRERTQSFVKAIGAENGYRVIYEQNNDASYSDWCALEKGLISVTVETGVDACPLPISQFPTIWSDNFDLLVFSAAYFTSCQ